MSICSKLYQKRLFIFVNTLRSFLCEKSIISVNCKEMIPNRKICVFTQNNHSYDVLPCRRHGQRRMRSSLKTSLCSIESSWKYMVAHQRIQYSSCGKFSNLQNSCKILCAWSFEVSFRNFTHFRSSFSVSWFFC